MKPRLLLLVLLSPFFLSAQSVIDSLHEQLTREKSDSDYVKTLIAIAAEYESDDSLLRAKENAEHALSVAKESHYSIGQINANEKLGRILLDLGDYPKALQFELTAVSIADSLGRLRSLSTCYNDIGIIYWYQGDLKQASDYYKKALGIQQQLKDTVGIAGSMNNLGIVYKNLGDTGTALFYYRQALDLANKVKYKKGMGNTYNNMGALFQVRGDLDRALSYYQHSLYIREEVNDKVGIATSLSNLGALYVELKDPDKAETYELEALGISKEIGDLEGIKEACYELSEIDSMKGDGMKALGFYKLYIAARDSLSNVEGKNNIQRMELQFQYESEKIAMQKDQEKQRALDDAKRSRLTFIIIAVSCGLLMVFLFLLFILNRLRIIRSQKLIIEKQKLEVEEKNKNITDSIYYAKRIQDSHLPTEKFIDGTIRRLKD